MKIKTFLLLSTLCASLYACKQDAKNNPASSGANAPDVSTAPPAQPSVHWYAVMVDKLNLRNQPNQGGQVLAQFAEGEIIEGTGKESANKEKVTLRGIEWEEPYHEIKYPAGGQSTGWAYGAALKRVYVGDRTQSPDLGQVSKFSNYLKTLDVKKLDSGKKAWQYVTTQMKNISPTTADATFVLLESFISRMEREGDYYKMTEKIKWTNEDLEAIWKRTYDNNKYPVLKPLFESGFTLEQGEGMVYPLVDWNRLGQHFSSSVTPSMKAYIGQQIEEARKPATTDAHLIISLEEVADRGAWWEKFLRQYPDFIRKEEAVEQARWPRSVLIHGGDDGPIADYETQNITPEIRKTWEYVQQKYPGTKIAGDVKAMADLCASEGWKMTKKVEDFQARYIEQNQ